MEYGLYIHIPYCRAHCRYCDFYTQPGARGVPQEYVDALLRDFAAYAPKQKSGIPVRPCTVYFGGGTPGLLSAQQVRRILHAVNPKQGAEITLETNPEQTDISLLAGWKEAGVNRLSVGVQTAREDSLRRLGRLHTARQAREALQNARSAGFSSVCGDIMLALPQYSYAEFDETLALLNESGANHISAYILKIEPGTPFGKKPPEGLPSEEECAAFYLYAVEQLEKLGYRQYEISNFAQPGHEGKHNMLYWDCRNYLGLGPSAHSCMEGRRFSFSNNLHMYLERENMPKEEGQLEAGDYIMLRLRLAAGLSPELLTQRFEVSLTAGQVQLLKTCVQQGLAKKSGDGWALTPQGLLVENAILVRLMELGEEKEEKR